MQVVFNNVDGNFNDIPIADVDASLLADENAAAAILDSMFTDDITLTFNIGVGFNANPNALPQEALGTNLAVANSNPLTNVRVTYDELRTALETSGQPGFFNDTNLPADIGTISNFYISSSQAKALDLAAPDGVDGYIGIQAASFGTPLTGDDRIATILHEVGHAMGRTTATWNNGGVINYPENDLVRFVSAGTRQFIGGPGAYFSLDGGATRLVNWANTSFSDFLNPPNGPNIVPGAPPVDPYSATIVTGGGTLATLTPLDIQVMEALGFLGPVIDPAAQAAAQAVALDPDPSDAVTANMVTRNVNNTTTTYAIYNLGANTVLASNLLDPVPVGNEFEFVTLGNFNESDPSDMLLRDSTSGTFQVIDIEDN